MAERDLPETATPWTDKLGNVWCVVFPGDSKTWVNVYLLLPDAPKWQMVETVRVYLVGADLLAGLGRTLPPVPTPKRVAKAVRIGLIDEIAARDGCLYIRTVSSSPGPWNKFSNVYGCKEHIAAAHEAFLGAGDVLPGEEASDA